MRRHIGIAVRLAVVLAIVLGNLYVVPAAAAPRECKNCYRCSDGPCCLGGTAWESCSRWYVDMCWVIKGGCSGKQGQYEGLDEGAIEPEGDIIQ